MVYSLSYIGEIKEPNSYSNSLYLQSIFFVIITVILVFPTIILLLKKSQDRDNIIDIINQYDEDWSMSYHENILWNDNQSHKHYEKDPTTLLTEIGTSSIKDFDQKTIETIIKGFQNLIDQTIENTTDNVGNIQPKTLYLEFNTLITNLFNSALKEKNERILIDCIRARFKLEKTVIKNSGQFKIVDHRNKYHGWAYNFDTSSFFDKAIRNREDEVCSRIIDAQEISSPNL